MNKYEQENFTKIVKNSLNLTDVCIKLGITSFYGNRSTVKKYINLYKIDISHFRINIKKFYKKMNLNEILIENSTFNRTHLKNRLYENGLKFRKCELCGQDENWNNIKISLILDHINGINNDNRIENLRIVCPNCNAGLSTHCGKNTKNNKKIYNHIIENNNICLDCGVFISKRSKRCKNCDEIIQRKVERPSYETLLKELEESNYSAVGRKYGVSDNSIRKWLKSYKKQLSQYENI